MAGKKLRYVLGLIFLIILALAILLIIATSEPEEQAPRSIEGSEVPRVVADSLSVPWGMAVLSDGTMLISERTGTLVAIRQSGSVEIDVPAVVAEGEGGLLGIALHPNFEDNRWLYLYHTTKSNRSVRNRVVRYTFRDDRLLEPVTIITDIPGASYHDGGRIAFGPDGYLYVTTGDSGNAALAQDRSSLAGKILRVTDAGLIPEDNPFEDSPVYSYGHRNPQGLAWDRDGNLWSTEHGRSGIVSGFDELNLIIPGGNYGWPEIQGDQTRAGMITSVLHSGPDTTWAPASLVAYDGALLWGGLRGESIYQVERTGTDVSRLTTYFTRAYGRIRTLYLHEDTLFFTTSNTDGRGKPKSGDDTVYSIPVSVLN